MSNINDYRNNGLQVTIFEQESSVIAENTWLASGRNQALFVQFCFKPKAWLRRHFTLLAKSDR